VAKSVRAARSLVVLDEVGRGTSTYDGVSIAWAIVEHLHDHVRCRALFATHYHELVGLARTRPLVANWTCAVRETRGTARSPAQIVFLRKIVPGGADRSYGLHVARLAGLPGPVLDRARDIQRGLEAKEGALPVSLGAAAPRGAAGERPPAAEASLFNPGDLVLAELSSIDTDKLTPLEALNRLAALKKRLRP
jgi:DNA mismatch repair protein MutS